jgi:hypothetical protein
MPENLAPLILQLFGIFAPIVRQVIEDRKAAGVAAPTDEEIIATFTADADRYLAEGAEWTRTHPRPPG